MATSNFVLNCFFSSSFICVGNCDAFYVQMFGKILFWRFYVVFVRIFKKKIIIQCKMENIKLFDCTPIVWSLFCARVCVCFFLFIAIINQLEMLRCFATEVFAIIQNIDIRNMQSTEMPAKPSLHKYKWFFPTR